VPVPIFQALEDLVVYVFALWVERRIARRGAGRIVVTAAVTLYGALGSTTSTCFYLTALVETSRFWSHRSPLWVAAQRCGWLLWRDRGVAHAAVTDPWRAP